MSRLRGALHRTIGPAIWNSVWGCNPPDWVLNLHWKCTIESGFECLKEVAALVEAYGPKKPPCSRSPEPHTADDGEGGAKTEGPQPHERWHSRKRKKLADHIGMPLLSQLVLSSRACGERQVQRVATCLHTVLQFAQAETSSQTRGSDPHSDHRRTSKEHRRDRDHRGISKEEPPTRKRTQPGELPEVRGHSPDSYSYYSDSQKSESS